MKSLSVFATSWAGHQSIFRRFSSRFIPRIPTNILSDRNSRQSKYLQFAFHQKDSHREFLDSSRGDVDFSSCDYLALAQHPALNKTESDAILRWNRIFHNRSAVYPRNINSPVKKFESECAAWLKSSETLLVNSGTEANVDVLQLLLTDNCIPVYMDKYAHYTFVFGARATGHSHIIYFTHNDADDLLCKIKEYGPGVVCIDTIYSAMGTVAPLIEIVDICNSNDCVLVADESHALGVVGDQGRGLVPMLGLDQYVPFRTSSLGKAFGAGGGLIAFSEEVAEGKYIIPYLGTIPIFSLAPQESQAERLLHALRLIQTEHWRREQLSAKTDYFRKGCINTGYTGQFVRNESTNIIPFVVGPIDFAKEVYDTLVANQIYPSPHFYPASPRNKSVIRFTICNTLTTEDIEMTLQFLKDFHETFKPWQWPDAKTEKVEMGFKLEQW